MDQIMSLLIELVVLVFALLFGRYVVPFLKIKLDENKLNLISVWALKFVKTSENLIVGSGRGNEKRYQVTTWLKEKADELGLKLTEDQIRTILEDAYTTMIQEANKVESK
jgi:LL-H family phage holin